MTFGSAPSRKDLVDRDQDRHPGLDLNPIDLHLCHRTPSDAFAALLAVPEPSIDKKCFTSDFSSHIPELLLKAKSRQMAALQFSTRLGFPHWPCRLLGKLQLSTRTLLASADVIGIALETTGRTEILLGHVLSLLVSWTSIPDTRCEVRRQHLHRP